MNISYDWYKIFAAAAECGSITAAAEKLYISQPAVSQCIRQLEEAVGCRLFSRTPRGVRLTREGEMLYSYISAGISAISGGERRLISMLRLDTGEIRIGASDMTLAYFLLPHLEKFHSLHPGIRISITNQPTPETVGLLSEGKIDFAAVSEPIDCPDEDISVSPVREIEDIFICGSKYSWLLEKEIPVSSLPADQLIMLERKTSTRAYLDAEFAKRGYSAQPKFELATSSLIVQFAERNLGVGCVVRDFATEALERGEVKEIKVTDPLPPRHICILRKTTDISRAADALMKLILGNE
ncbi:MAG TPA: LysR family transcriptional regulator [Bacillota bacterium]|nr:LysR family transcriptional regulator [Bacillota bacterium]